MALRQSLHHPRPQLAVTMRTDPHPYRRPPPPQLSPEQLEHIERFLRRMKRAKGDGKVQGNAGLLATQHDDVGNDSLEEGEIREDSEEKDGSDRLDISPVLNPVLFPPVISHHLPSPCLQAPHSQPSAPTHHTPLHLPSIPSLTSLSLSPPSASYIVPYPPAWTHPSARARDSAYTEWEQRERTMAYVGDERGSARWVRTVPRVEGLEVVWGIAGVAEQDGD